MKKIALFFVSILTCMSFFQSSFALDIFTNSNEIIYCKEGDDCSLNKGTQIVKDGINDIEKNRKFSVWIQDVVKYLLTFISIIAVLYIIYAGFKVLTSAGNDEAVKKSKTTIFSVLVGIAIIRLAYGIVTWILQVLAVA